MDTAGRGDANPPKVEEFSDHPKHRLLSGESIESRVQLLLDVESIQRLHCILVLGLERVPVPWEVGVDVALVIEVGFRKPVVRLAVLLSQLFEPREIVAGRTLKRFLGQSLEGHIRRGLAKTHVSLGAATLDGESEIHAHGRSLVFDEKDTAKSGETKHDFLRLERGERVRRSFTTVIFVRSSGTK